MSADEYERDKILRADLDRILGPDRSHGMVLHPKTRNELQIRLRRVLELINTAVDGPPKASSLDFAAKCGWFDGYAEQAADELSRLIEMLEPKGKRPL